MTAALNSFASMLCSFYRLFSVTSFHLLRLNQGRYFFLLISFNISTRSALGSVGSTTPTFLVISDTRMRTWYIEGCTEKSRLHFCWLLGFVFFGFFLIIYYLFVSINSFPLVSNLHPYRITGFFIIITCIGCYSKQSCL